MGMKRGKEVENVSVQEEGIWTEVSRFLVLKGR